MKDSLVVFATGVLVSALWPSSAHAGALDLVRGETECHLAEAAAGAAATARSQEPSQERFESAYAARLGRSLSQWEGKAVRYVYGNPNKLVPLQASAFMFGFCEGFYVGIQPGAVQLILGKEKP